MDLNFFSKLFGLNFIWTTFFGPNLSLTQLFLEQQYFFSYLIFSYIFRLNKIWLKKVLGYKRIFDSKFFCSKFWVKKERQSKHKISFESKTILVHKIGVQKISLVAQEKFWGAEKLVSLKKMGQKQI